MPDLAAIAQRLKQVRDAQQRFLALWAVDCLLDRPQADQRLRHDLTGCTRASGDRDNRTDAPHRTNLRNE